MELNDIQKALRKKFPSSKRNFQDISEVCGGKFQSDITNRHSSSFKTPVRNEPTTDCIDNIRREFIESLREEGCNRRKFLRTEQRYSEIPPLRPINPDVSSNRYNFTNQSNLPSFRDNFQTNSHPTDRQEQGRDFHFSSPRRELLSSPCQELPCIKLSCSNTDSSDCSLERLRSLSPENYESRQSYYNDRPNILHAYLEKRKDSRVTSNISQNSYYANSGVIDSEAETTNPMCLRTASTMIQEVVATKLTEPKMIRQFYEEQKSPTTSSSKKASNEVYQKQPSQPRCKNMFQSAHHELLGISNPSTSNCASPSPEEPPELIKIHSDGEDSRSDSDSNMSDDSSYEVTSHIIDTSSLSSGEILNLIQIPDLVAYTPDLDSVSNFLEPHQIGHINHLIKCYADAIFTINVPFSAIQSDTFSPVDFIDIHMCGVLQTYYILLKSEDFLSLDIRDQVTLLQSLLPAIIALGFPLYRSESKSWTIPTVKGQDKPFSYGIYSLLQILPKSLVSRLVEIHETSHRLNVDWTTSMLFLLIFVFTPIKRTIVDMEKINTIRNTYVKLLHKYLEWKVGQVNIGRIFHEILKLMDSIMRHSQEVQDVEFFLREEEISVVQSRIKQISTQNFPGSESKSESLIKDETPMKFVSFSNIHAKMSSLMIKSVLMSECSTETYNDQKSEIYRAPLNLSNAKPISPVFMGQSTPCN